MINFYLVVAMALLGINNMCWADDWPMEGKNPLHKPISADVVIPPLRIAWIFSTGDSITSSPVEKDEIVYVGSYDGQFYAVDAKTGKEVWRFKSDDDLMFWAPAAVGNSVIVIGGCDGIIYGRDAKTGASLWKVRTQGVISGGGTIVNNVVYIGSMDNNMYALDLKTGKEKWRYFANWYFLTAPLVDAENNILYTNAHDHMGYVLDARNGNLIWKKQVTLEAGFPNNGPPCLDEGRLFMSVHPGNFRCFNASTGEPIWKTNSGANHPGCVVIDNKVITGTNVGLAAYNTENGEVVWAFADGAYVSRCTPAISGNVVYFCSRNGKVYGIDVENGNKLWEFATAGPIDGSPVIANGRLYVTSTDGNLYCFISER